MHNLVSLGLPTEAFLQHDDIVNVVLDSVVPMNLEFITVVDVAGQSIKSNPLSI